MLKLVLVGHTNVGKTSLLRTLTRDVDFGEVSHRPSTTRHVEGARLSVAGEALLELYDTPGLEDAQALFDYLESVDASHKNAASPRLDGPARLGLFLEGSEARQRFEQEAKVLRQLLKSDAGLYVIDAREPVLAKYRDELQILASAGKPLLPVLNFVGSREQREPVWREALARLGLHALVRFDSVAPPIDGERQLYESLALLLEHSRPTFQRLLTEHEHQRQARRASAAHSIAELLIDCAAYRTRVASLGSAAEQAVEALRQTIRQREQRCVETLLRIYAFRRDDATASDLPLLDGRWGDDLFNPETLKQLGIRLSSGIAAGAAAGAGVDILAGGLTLGAAALVGAIAGGALQTARSYGDRLVGKLRGQRELTVDDAVLRLLALRQQRLLAALERRGHAALDKIELRSIDEHTWRQGKLPEALRKARAHAEWSALNNKKAAHAAGREEQLERLATVLHEQPVNP